MKYFILLLLPLQLLAQSQKNHEGTWQFNVGYGMLFERVIFNVKGDSLCGVLMNTAFCSKMNKGQITFRAAGFAFEGTIKNNALIEGTYTRENSVPLLWNAAKELPTRVSKKWNYIPQNFYRRYSSLETPCLRLTGLSKAGYHQRNRYERLPSTQPDF